MIMILHIFICKIMFVQQRATAGQMPETCGAAAKQTSLWWMHFFLEFSES